MNLLGRTNVIFLMSPAELAGMGVVNWSTCGVANRMIIYFEYLEVWLSYGKTVSGLPRYPCIFYIHHGP